MSAVPSARGPTRSGSMPTWRSSTSGDVRGRVCVISDDIIDTAGTIQKAAQALRDNGASRVLACAVHGVLSGPAIQRIEAAPIDKLIVTNTVPLGPEKAACDKIVVLSVA